MACPSPDRRRLLGTGGAALGASLLQSCGVRRAPSIVLPSERRSFARVRVSPARVIRTVVGLRPFRPSGFVVRTEAIEDKTIVHNYGHGGGGVTLSWGTAHLAAEEAQKTGVPRMAVLGCGAVGLATARLLQRRGIEVTIYARDLPPQTTSNIAGAQWSPVSVADADRRTPAFDEQLARAARLSHRYFQDLVGAGYGVRWIENYFVSDSPPRGSWERDLTPELYPELRVLRRDEHPFGNRHVLRVVTMLIEPHVYLSALLRDFQLNGGRIVVRELAGRQAVLMLPEAVVINCTGLGAKELFGDEELMPVKGQLTVLLPQPEVDYAVIAPHSLYMFPRSDGVLLGGTFERGVSTLEPNAEAAERILTGHARLFGEMG